MATPSEQTLLLTGANSYVGSHIIQLALSKGYHVRGVVRSSRSIPGILAKFPSHASQLSFAEVPDITNPSLFAPAFDSPPRPITGVIHVASPFTLTVSSNKADLLDPAINGSLAILSATAQYGGPSVRRIIVTSSFASILDVNAGARPGYTYTEADWNPMTYDEATTAPGPAAYCASKALAEKAMWDWVAEHKPPFGLVVVNPPWVFGPHVGGIEDLNHLNESTHALYSLIGAKEVPPLDFAGFVDARTLAEAHISAFESKEEGVVGERFLVGGHFDWQSVADAVREELPELKERIPVGNPGVVQETYVVDGSKAERALGIKYIGLRESMRDSYKQLLEAEKKASAKSG